MAVTGAEELNAEEKDKTIHHEGHEEHEEKIKTYSKR